MFILPQEDKPRTTTDYDAIVCAELPNSETETELFKLVARHNIHGPCGEHCVPPNHQPSCCANSNNGQCHRHYPKDFQEETTCTEDGFPVYRRRENPNNLPYRPCIRKKGVALDNRWVVPYNRVLTQSYVEIMLSFLLTIHEYRLRHILK